MFAGLKKFFINNPPELKEIKEIENNYCLTNELNLLLITYFKHKLIYIH